MKARTILELVPVALGAAALVVPDVALAQRDADPYAPAPVVAERTANAPLYTDWGLGVTAGGGVTGFTNSYVNSITDVGGAWNAIITLGTRSPIALEAQYIGSASSIHTNLLQSSTMVSNGVTGDLRVNILPWSVVTPYVFGGLGWRRYTISNDSVNLTGLRNRTDVLELPIGGGLAFHYNGFMLDGRFDYRFSFYDDIVASVPQGSIGNPNNNNSGMQNWNAIARVGVEF